MNLATTFTCLASHKNWHQHTSVSTLLRYQTTKPRRAHPSADVSANSMMGNLSSLPHLSARCKPAGRVAEDRSMTGARQGASERLAAGRVHTRWHRRHLQKVSERHRLRVHRLCLCRCLQDRWPGRWLATSARDPGRMHGGARTLPSKVPRQTWSGAVRNRDKRPSS